jgi:hypothetical protein
MKKKKAVLSKASRVQKAMRRVSMQKRDDVSKTIAYSTDMRA